MRNREILLLGAGLTGAFFFGLGKLTIETPPAAVRSAPAPDHGLVEADPGQFGWFPAQVPQPKEGNGVIVSRPSSVAEPGDAGIWSLPAEFADPE